MNHIYCKIISCRQSLVADLSGQLVFLLFVVGWVLVLHPVDGIDIWSSEMPHLDSMMSLFTFGSSSTILSGLFLVITAYSCPNSCCASSFVSIIVSVGFSISTKHIRPFSVQTVARGSNSKESRYPSKVQPACKFNLFDDIMTKLKIPVPNILTCSTVVKGSTITGTLSPNTSILYGAFRRGRRRRTDGGLSCWTGQRRTKHLD